MTAAALSVVPRTVSVERLTWREELLNVLRVGALIVLGVWIYLATALDDAKGGRGLLPFQQLVRERPAVDQRMFRELQEGLLEAEVGRSIQGSWPTIDALTSSGIPPFAFDPTAKAARYQWQMIRSGAFVNYLGIPDRAGAPAWLLWIQEPDPGVPPDQNVEDEEHHRLTGGSMLHVSTWSHVQGARVVAGLVQVPQAEGWTQLYAVGPGSAR